MKRLILATLAGLFLMTSCNLGEESILYFILLGHM